MLVWGRSILAALLASCLLMEPLSAQLAIRAGTLYTMAGPPISDGVVLIREGKIERVGPASELRIPADYRLLQARIATPGLVDAHTVVGLSGYLNQLHDQDQLEHSAAIQPELRAIDAYDARERLVEWLRQFGITTIHAGHAPGALISGQTLIAKTRGESIEDAVIVPVAMVAATLGEEAQEEGGKSPGTRPKMMALLRAQFVEAQEYLRKLEAEDQAKRPPRDLGLETLGRVLRQDLPLLVTAQRAHDILNAVRLAEEFAIRLILDGAAEAYLVIDHIREANVPVIVHPTMFRASGERENLSMETAAKLRQAGIQVALQSGYESYVPKTRVVLFEAAIAAANGLSFEEALATVTIGAARILGIEERLGSLEPGKDGDVALFDGDPFEYTTHVVGVVIEGELVSDQPH